MAYRLTYQMSMDWIGPGSNQTVGPAIYGAPSSGNSQTLTLFNKAGGQTIAGSTTVTIGSATYSGAIATADITTLVNAAAADMIAQFQAATPAAVTAAGSGVNQPPLPQMQGWVAGYNTASFQG